MSLQTAFDKIRASDIQYKQLIIECGAWIHISRSDGKPKRMALIATGTGALAGVIRDVGIITPITRIPIGKVGSTTTHRQSRPPMSKPKW
jgi:hypothetical protein